MRRGLALFAALLVCHLGCSSNRSYLALTNDASLNPEILPSFASTATEEQTIPPPEEEPR